jgi:hypothetical protein
MHFRLILVITTCIFFSCKERKTPFPESEELTDDSSFTYKTLIADSFIDTLSSNDLPKLFGNWKITAIGKTGGSGQKETVIQSQIGKHLRIDSDKVKFALFDDTAAILKPSFSIDHLIRNESSSRQSLEGTTLFYGYGGSCRKTAPQLIVSDKLFFEVLNFSEMTTYADGRIYFLTKQ